MKTSIWLHCAVFVFPAKIVQYKFSLGVVGIVWPNSSVEMKQIQNIRCFGSRARRLRESERPAAVTLKQGALHYSDATAVILGV